MLARLLLKLVLCPSLSIMWSGGGASSVFIMRSSSWEHDTDLPYKEYLSSLLFLQLKDTDQCRHCQPCGDFYVKIMLRRKFP